MELLRRESENFNTFFLAMAPLAGWSGISEHGSGNRDQESGTRDRNLTVEEQAWHKEEARKWYDRAVEWMEKNQPADEELKRFRAEAEELLGAGSGQ